MQALPQGAIDSRHVVSSQESHGNGSHRGALNHHCHACGKLNLSIALKQVKDDEAAKIDAFWEINSYVKGSYTELEAFKILNQELLKIEGKSTGNRLFYLALPPSVFAPVTTNIKACCMSTT